LCFNTAASGPGCGNLALFPASASGAGRLTIIIVIEYRIQPTVSAKRSGSRPARRPSSINTMKISPILAVILASFCLTLPACRESVGQQAEDLSSAEHPSEEHPSEGEHEESHKIVVTSPVKKDVITTQKYVCQIHSRRHIEVCALDEGYLEEIKVKEGQAVKQGDPIFKILPVLYQARLNADLAEAQLAQIEFNNSQKLFKDHYVSDQDVALAQAKLAKAQAKVELARAELNFADIKAPFDGIIGQQLHQQGSLIAEGDVLTTLSDNDVMWVYFNVPEADYLQYKADMTRQADGVDGDAQQDGELKIELMLANHNIFPQPGHISAVEADFNNVMGTIAFRADFPNPGGLLRHGQTGTILIHHELKDAIVIPQRAKFEILAKLYVFVVDEHDVVHQREIEIQNEMDDVYVIKKGLQAGNKIVLEGIRQVRDGEKVEYEFRDPVEVLAHLKNKAE
jgi:membrane fusion protein (multidrug efflux system)